MRRADHAARPGARLRWALGAALAALSLTAAQAALAGGAPSVWERARDPEVAEAHDLHLSVQRRLIVTSMTAVDFGERGRVLAMLERAGAARSRSPELRFDLGLVYSLLEEHGRAAEVLRSALTDFPDHARAGHAWLRLAFACGHLGDHECEREAYLEVLRRETEDLYRATPTLNLAEAHMHLGDLADAIEGYREALRIAGRVPARETAPLALWGLALALDRSGDRIGAEREARFAHELEQSMGYTRLLRSKDVFFVPAYEVHWYEGLGAVARARVVGSARDALPLFRSAEASFGAYVRLAEASAAGDPWLPIARARLAEVVAERQRAEKAAGREPRPPRRARDEGL